MTRLASRFGAANLIRRDRPLTREELYRVVPSVFSEDKHESRSEKYTYIPTISLLDSLQREGFQPFFACQTLGDGHGADAQPLRDIGHAYCFCHVPDQLSSFILE